MSSTEKRKPIVLSFFSGAMGFDLGLERAGFDIALTCEIDKYCRQTIAANRPQTPLLEDILLYSKEDILKITRLKTKDIDVIVGGPPCQAFSTAGKRKAFNDERGNVFLKFIDLSLSLNPKYIVIENVRGLLSCPLEHKPHKDRKKNENLRDSEKKGSALQHVLNKLKKSGYSYSFNLYNAANFGSPQVRERVIIVCSRMDKKIPFLTPTHSEKEGLGLKKWKTFREAVKGLDKHDSLSFPEKRLQFYKLLKAGQNWKSLPEDLQKKALGNAYYSGGGKTGFLRRVAWDRPAPTLVTHPAMPATDLAHPKEQRPLSIQEYKRVQEFPDDWFLSGPLLQQYKQVGNAVPNSLGYSVGVLLKKLLKKEKVKEYPGFLYSRYKNTSHENWKPS